MSIQEYHPIENTGFYLLVVGALLSMVTYIWQFRKMPGGKPQAYIQVCKGIWLASMVMVSISTSLQDKIVWGQLMQTAGILLPYFWLMFVVDISRQKEKIPVTVLYSMKGLISFLAVGILLNPWNRLFWQDVWLDGQTMKVVLGPGIWITRPISFLFCILAIGFSLRWILDTVGLRRRQALLFTMAGLVSAIGSVLAFVPVAHRVASVPLSFLISGLIITWGFYRWHTYNVLSLSQEVVVRDMIDGLVVVDEYGYIADLNPAAQIMMRDAPSRIGGRVDKLFVDWPELIEVLRGDAAKNIEVIREYPEGRRFFRLNMTPLKTRNQWLGNVIVIKDITEQQKQHLKLLEQQKALSILNERARLGRELHDGRAQICNFLGLELETFHFLLCDGQTEKAIKQVDKLREIIKDLNIDIRESIVGLNKMTAPNHNFALTLREYVEWYEKTTGIATELIFPSQPVDSLFSDSAKLQLLRIVQEALTNVRKHAKARRVKVQIDNTGNQVTVLIADDGCGFDTTGISGKQKSFGLQIMAERAKEAGGRFEIATQPGAGTKVVVYFRSDTKGQDGGCEHKKNPSNGWGSEEVSP